MCGHGKVGTEGSREVLEEKARHQIKVCINSVLNKMISLFEGNTLFHSHKQLETKDKTELLENLLKEPLKQMNEALFTWFHESKSYYVNTHNSYNLTSERMQ